MKAFVTGGSGFIGSYLIRQLVAQGYEVFALVRSSLSATFVEANGAQAIQGNVLDVESMRDSMQGSDVVFHLAAWYKVGSPDWMKAEVVNVQGTRNVLTLAHELGIPKTVYTSTVAVFGDTKGQIVDETYTRPEVPFLNRVQSHQMACPLQSG